MELSVVVVAGGSGHRMGADIPKQYLELEGKPIIVRTIEGLIHELSFLPEVQLIWVHPKGDGEYVRELIETFLPNTQSVITVEGGASRADSVWNGLQKATSDYVMIHDGVRPFVTAQLLRRLWDKRVDAAVIPAILPTDSIRLASSEGQMTAFPRNKVRLVQTPQLFDCEMLKNCYELYQQKPDENCTDDASIVERYSDNVIAIVEGDEQNIKITTPKDMALGEWYLKQRTL